jgi:uncharacterized Zn ribbon protein
MAAIQAAERVSALPRELHSDASEAAGLLALHQEIQHQGHALLEKARELGDRLAVQKAKVGHGGWSRWVDQYLPEMGQRQAGNYLRIAAEWPKLQGYLEGGDSETVSLRGAIAYLSEAQALPSLEELAELWAPVGRIGKTGRRKNALVVEAHDDTFGQRYSFPKLFPGRKALRDHWETHGAAYVAALDAIAAEKAAKIASVPPVGPVSDRPVSSPSLATQGGSTGQDGAADAWIYRDGSRQELAVGDRVMLIDEPERSGSIVEFVPGAVPRPVWVLWNDCGQKDRRDGIELHRLQQQSRFQVGEFVKGPNAQGAIAMGCIFKVGYTTGWLRDAEGRKHPFKMAEVQAMTPEEVEVWLAVAANTAIAEGDRVCMIEDPEVSGEVLKIEGSTVTVAVVLEDGSSIQRFAEDQLRKVAGEIGNGVSDLELEAPEPEPKPTPQQRHHERMTNRQADDEGPSHDENYTGSNLWQPILDEWGRAEFDLDFATADGSPVPARVRITKELDMFRHPWTCDREDGGERLCFGNPPFSINEAWSLLFCDRLEQGIFEHAFIVEKADSRTQWHQRLLQRATAVCRVYGCQKFINPDSLKPRPGATFAIDLFYFGNALPRFARACRGLGLVTIPYTATDVDVEAATCD